MVQSTTRTTGVLSSLASWAVLFGSKFVILEAVDIVFGEDVDLGGVVPFIVIQLIGLTLICIFPQLVTGLLR